MTVGELVQRCVETIGHGDEARNEAREIVATMLDVNRSWPSLHSEDLVNEEVHAESLRAARSRAEGAPLQYATGRAFFRHLTLRVDRRVLSPRPETELLVDVVLSRAGSGSIADVGTGSGAIAIALATEGRYDRIIATDISAAALEVAGGNASAYAGLIRGALELRLGSLLEPLAGESLDVIVSNPPYIAEGEMSALPNDVREWEPAGALRSGGDGLEATKEIIAGAPGVLKPGGLLAMEVDARRADRTADILQEDRRYCEIEVIADLTGRQRFAIARRR